MKAFKKGGWANWIILSAVLAVIEVIALGSFHDWNIFQSYQTDIDVYILNIYRLPLVVYYPIILDALTMPLFLLLGVFFYRLHRKTEKKIANGKSRRSAKAWAKGTIVGDFVGGVIFFLYLIWLVSSRFMFLNTAISLIIILGFVLGVSLTRSTKSVVITIVPWLLAVGCFSPGGIVPGLATLGSFVGAFICGGLAGLIVFAVFIVIANVISFLYCNGDDLYKAIKRKFAKKVVRNG